MKKWTGLYSTDKSKIYFDSTIVKCMINGDRFTLEQEMTGTVTFNEIEQRNCIRPLDKYDHYLYVPICWQKLQIVKDVDEKKEEIETTKDKHRWRLPTEDELFSTINVNNCLFVSTIHKFEYGEYRTSDTKGKATRHFTWNERGIYFMDRCSNPYKSIICVRTTIDGKLEWEEESKHKFDYTLEGTCEYLEQLNANN